MQRDYLYFMTFLLVSALFLLSIVRLQVPIGTLLYVLYGVFTTISIALWVLWAYHFKLLQVAKERCEIHGKGGICFDLSKSYTNSKISYIVKYNDGNGDEITMGTLEHVADTIKKVSMYRSYKMRTTSVSCDSMYSVDQYSQSNFFTPAEMDRLNSLLLKSK
jgi:hypothetical protein